MTRQPEWASLPLRERIAAVVDASGLDQDQFADAIGVSRETVSRWVNGRVAPKRPFRVKLAALASDLYDGRVSPDVFREHMEPRSIEDALADLAATTRDLSEATRALVDLLAEQRSLVERMSRLADQLRPPQDPPEHGGGCA